MNDAGHVNRFELDLLLAVTEACRDLGKVRILDLVAKYVDSDYVKGEVFALLEESSRIPRRPTY